MPPATGFCRKLRSDRAQHARHRRRRSARRRRIRRAAHGNAAGGANLVAQRLLQNLHQTDFVIENNRLHGSASIGVVTCPDHGQDLETLLTRADIAMYRAKQAGRNRFHVFSDDDLGFDSKMRATIYWEERIKQATQGGPSDAAVSTDPAAHGRKARGLRGAAAHARRQRQSDRARGVPRDRRTLGS